MRAFACAAVFLCSGAGAAQAQRNPADTVEVLSLDFDGVRSFPEELLRASIVTVPTQCISVALEPICWLGISKDRHYFDPLALATDVFRLRLFYHQRGFREARVQLDTTRAPGGMHIRFHIDEGRPVLTQTVTVEGADEIGGGIARNLPVRRNQPFSQIDFYAARDTLIARLANRGYAAADVLANYEIATEDRYRADVEFQLIPGSLTHFGEIAIEGLARVSPGVVRRMLMFEEGDLYSRQALLRSQRNLFGLEVFRHAEILTPTPTENDTVLPVLVRVNEGDMHRVRVGAGISTSDFVNAEGRWVSRNFFGGARRLELRGRVSNIAATPLHYLPGFESCSGIYCDVAGALSADFSQPWFFHPQNTFGAGAFVERFTLPRVYVRTTRGGYLSLRRVTATKGVFTGGYRPELTRLESDGDLIFCVNFVACEAREIDVLRAAHWLAPFAFSFALDRSNSVFAPTAGIIVRMDAEYASAATGSEFDYVRALGEVSGYHDPFRGVVIAMRLRPGWARAVGAPGTGLGLHPQKRFFAGGPNSVRGFAQYRLGPKLLTVDATTLAQPVARDGAGCEAQAINAGTCDVAALAAAVPEAFEVRPVGGAVLLEGNLEVRMPVWTERIRGAVFLDFGQVWQGHNDVRLSQLEWTPGVGIRYFSPVGPIRIDVGYNSSGAERLTVVTTEVCDNRNPEKGCLDIVPGQTYLPDQLGNRRKLRTLAPVMWRPYDRFLDRLQFHFSIGQAF